MTDFYTMVTSYYDMTCTAASVDPILDIGSCVTMKKVVGSIFSQCDIQLPITHAGNPCEFLFFCVLKLPSVQIPRCQKWLRESCVDQYDTINCGAASNFCNTMLYSPFQATGV